MNSRSPGSCRNAASTAGLLSATVTERIDNIAAKGYVTAGGRLWPARSKSGEPIEKDTVTVVRSIEGIKLIVEPLSAE